MPFYNERRLFFKSRQSTTRKWAHIVLLIGVSFLSGQLAAQYGFGNERMLSVLAFAPPGLEGNLPSKLSSDAQVISSRVSMKLPLLEAPPKAVSTDLSVAVKKKELPGNKAVPVPVLITSRTPSDYSTAPSETFKDSKGFSKVPKSPVVTKAVRVELEVPNSSTTALITHEPPEQALTSVTKVDQGTSKTRAQSKSVQRLKVSRRSQKPRGQASKPSTIGDQPGYQNLPKWAGRALFDTSQ